MTIAYRLGSGLYLNITNACACNCIFCIRNNVNGVGDAKSLWLETEPSISEITEAIDSYYPFSGINEIVFCGFGEPLERADVVIAVSQHIKKIKPALPVRLNTNGLVFLMHPGFDISQLAIIDTMSISLNADDAVEYTRISRPRYGEKAFDAMLDFARKASKICTVVLSVLDGTLSPERVNNCQRIATEMGASFKIRPME